MNLIRTRRSNKSGDAQAACTRLPRIYRGSTSGYGVPGSGSPCDKSDAHPDFILELSLLPRSGSAPTNCPFDQPIPFPLIRQPPDWLPESHAHAQQVLPPKQEGKLRNDQHIHQSDCSLPAPSSPYESAPPCAQLLPRSPSQALVCRISPQGRFAPEPAREFSDGRWRSRNRGDRGSRILNNDDLPTGFELTPGVRTEAAMTTSSVLDPNNR